eukprot:scaffold90163_cov48-Attheya_sp.AAC.1
MVFSLLLLPAAVSFLLLPAAANVKTCRTKLKERGSPSSQLLPFTDTGGISLCNAVNDFVKDGADWDGGQIYGENITDWDVSQVTDFRLVFQNMNTFNDDIVGWDVSSGNNFYAMFNGATAFNQDIGSWNVSSGTFFDISGWDMSSGTVF